eukprot:CAMPEP_0117454506 /NCGR_PEP_ID=MMETSP0759-20121206/10835_1 /TAXON_ID=63605 /ORGANISM="Percolomonas cosmopolitus, Strain WS" /LENGTH=266 /DNA_ID=CAMNT_0005247693 /DNA_START=64 /DNA_END=861 /DNA_ORIENTATION=-
MTQARHSSTDLITLFFTESYTIQFNPASQSFFYNTLAHPTADAASSLNGLPNGHYHDSENQASSSRSARNAATLASEKPQTTHFSSQSPTGSGTSASKSSQNHVQQSHRSLSAALFPLYNSYFTQKLLEQKSLNMAHFVDGGYQFKLSHCTQNMMGEWWRNDVSDSGMFASGERRPQANVNDSTVDQNVTERSQNHPATTCPNSLHHLLNNEAFRSHLHSHVAFKMDLLLELAKKIMMIHSKYCLFLNLDRRLVWIGDAESKGSVW